MKCKVLVIYREDNCPYNGVSLLFPQLMTIIYRRPTTTQSKHGKEGILQLEITELAFFAKKELGQDVLIKHISFPSLLTDWYGVGGSWEE